MGPPATRSFRRHWSTADDRNVDISRWEGGIANRSIGSKMFNSPQSDRSPRIFSHSAKITFLVGMRPAAPDRLERQILGDGRERRSPTWRLFLRTVNPHKRSRINAISQSPITGPVRENMPQVRVTNAAENLDPTHAVRGVFFVANNVVGSGLGEARPARA